MRSAVGHYKAGRDNGDRKEGKMASEIRERIIDTAWKLFHEKGFSETTINDIIREAEISKGTFYYYFRSKDNMLDTLSVILDAEYERLAAEIPEDMDSFDKLLKSNMLPVYHGFLHSLQHAHRVICELGSTILPLHLAFAHRSAIHAVARTLECLFFCHSRIFIPVVFGLRKRPNRLFLEKLDYLTRNEWIATEVADGLGNRVA